MALLQFMTCRLPTCAVPASIHCDHLIRAHTGAEADLTESIENNREVFDFLESAASKYGIEFWKPGSGIIHQIVLENYAAPGLLMLGTDSALTDTPWELKAPMVTGVKLVGELKGWATPKDLILHLAGKLTVRVCPPYPVYDEY
jgi:homoaconitase